MCIVIDTNTLPSVFDKKNKDHEQFKPVLDWIISGNGKVVYGGTKFIEEIGPKLLALFVALKTAGKAVNYDNVIVDNDAIEISGMIQHKDFDDQHIVALLRKSGCKLICSLDARAYPYFQHSMFFSPRKKPKIYSSLRNADLLSNTNIAKICMPCTKLNRKSQALLGIE